MYKVGDKTISIINDLINEYSVSQIYLATLDAY